VNNILPCVLSSTSAGPGIPGQQFPLFDTGAAWTENGTNLNTDYSVATLVTAGGVGIKERVVAASIRVKYDGPRLTASGVFNCVEQSDHQTLSNLTLDTIGQYESFFSISVNSQMERPDPWVYLNYTPVDNSDFDFQQDSASNATSTVVTNQNHFIGMLMTGIPLGGDYFTWEAIVHFEVIGQTVRSKTDTPADPVGTAAVTNALKPETQKTLNSNQTVMQAVKENSSESTVTSIIKSVAPIAQQLMPLVPLLL